MDEAYDPEDETLKHRQGGAIYPLGKVLRSTYDADNHETLSAEVTALMINLSRVPYEPCAKDPVVVMVEQPAARSLISRVRNLLQR